jgi:hypothetical protein
MQESWENMANHDRFDSVASSIGSGLENLKKWYRKVDDTDAYFICLGKCDNSIHCLVLMHFVALDPNFKLAYAEAKWDTEFYEEGLDRLNRVV